MNKIQSTPIIGSLKRTSNSLQLLLNPDAENHASNAEVYKNYVRPVSQVLRERRLRYFALGLW